MAEACTALWGVRDNQRPAPAPARMRTRTRSTGGQAHMSPAKAIGPEATAYAATLRTVVNHFIASGGTQKEIAVSAHIAPATLSRYLSGERIAPSSFIAALDAFLTQRGRPLETGIRDRLDELCGLAHEASGSPAVQLAHLKEELARIQAEKKAGKTELAALQEHADQLADQLRQALDQARSSEEKRLALEERAAGQENSLQHAQAYTRQLQTELTSLQEQVVLIQREVKVLRQQNKRLIEEEGTASPGPRSKAVSGASTQAANAREETSRSSGSASGGSKKRDKPGTPPQEQTPRTGPQVTPPQPATAFTISWTGNEDPRTFTKNKKAMLGGGLMPLGVIFLYTGSQVSGVAALVYIITGLVCLPVGYVLYDDTDLPKLMHQRTLHLDNTGLTTNDTHGKQHFSWTSIKKISIHHTPEKIHNRAPLALHLQLHPAAKEADRTSRPAGWPLAQTPPAACRRPPRTYMDEWVPVCVLGPLTGPEKTDLQNTITHYLKKAPEGVW
ncbi:hypothetical protein ACFWGI_17020 [Streptomyces niveus]|uniref:hypothetical protein n=1 Tax=Streptomyces niveus TaxID=193462 RepID=UPI0036668766